MTRLSRFQRLALLTASTTVITGGALLPSTAFAAPAPDITSVAVAEARWVETKDAPSGITAQLPEKTKAQKVPGGRTYVATADSEVVQFSVVDAPGFGQTDLKVALKGYLMGYNETAKSSDEKVTSANVREGTTADGHHSLHADVRSPDGTVGHIGLIDVGDHVIQIATIGTDVQPDIVKSDHKKLVDSIQVPADKRAQAT
ncbi:hypothetical protein SSP24_44660 [Streptomyces spinoverrucosus]|uniref:Uncharacterized protein n=1 Tax=Streptomyces spinoverrucosus TaxID=284043 RepID=A0A4Y3VM70_9ACTN|nr:hypothetical protein [Streptomyces spinoverrucosus]GEC06811.1 hypothetical protein SSP24_44660 [Streptomyces spinoverrucosus]GHB80208.1 hypothetical protein GCM10010397_58690 [Streptomyces spinoverrucosus]